MAQGGNVTPGWKRPRILNKLGFMVAMIHLAATVAYFYFRIRYTLGGAAREHPEYARFVLIVELLSAVSMLLYSSNLLFVTELQVIFLVNAPYPNTMRALLYDTIRDLGSLLQLLDAGSPVCQLIQSPSTAVASMH